MIRLQGKEFAEMKGCLKLIGYQVSLNGNIRAILKYKTGCSKKKFVHWLNNEEAERFKKSDFYQNNQPLTDEELYKKENKNV